MDNNIYRSHQSFLKNRLVPLCIFIKSRYCDSNNVQKTKPLAPRVSTKESSGHFDY